nr:DMT family transporter [Mameliella sediminis]
MIAAVCWGLHDIAVRYLSRSVALLAALLVALFSGLVFQGVVILVRGEWLLPTGPALWYAVAAGVAFLVASVGLYYAFHRGPVRLVSPIIGAFPILSLIFAALDGSPITTDQLATVGLVIAAVAVVAILSDPSEGDIPPRGPTVVFSLISAVGYATTFRLGQLAAETGGEWQSSFATRLTALLLLGAVLLVMRKDIRVGRKAILPLLTMGVLDGIALLSVISAASMAQPEFAAVAASIFGLFTILLARVFLDEQMRLAQWAGCIVAFAGIGYLTL